MTNKRISILAMGLAIGLLSARAASAAPDAEAWRGAYAGIDLGYGSSRLGATFRIPQVVAGVTGTDNVRLKGVMGGLQLGYRTPLTAHIVLGVEASAELASLTGTSTAVSCSAADCFITNTTRQHDRAKSVETLQASLGYASGGWLPYIKAGLAVGQYKGEGLISNILSSTPFLYRKSTAGWSVGAGLERRVGEHLSWKVAYDYVRLAPFNEVAPTGALGHTRVAINGNLIRTGFSYRF